MFDTYYEKTIEYDLTCLKRVKDKLKKIKKLKIKNNKFEQNLKDVSYIEKEKQTNKKRSFVDSSFILVDIAIFVCGVLFNPIYTAALLAMPYLAANLIINVKNQKKCDEKIKNLINENKILAEEIGDYENVKKQELSLKIQRKIIIDRIEKIINKDVLDLNKENNAKNVEKAKEELEKFKKRMNKNEEELTF